MSKESSHIAFQKGEEFLLFLENKGYSPKSIRMAFEGVSCFWKNFSELSRSNLLSYRDFLIKNYKPTAVNLRIWAINLYTKFLSNIFSESEEKIIKPSLSIEGISPEYSAKEYSSFWWFPLLRNAPSDKRQILENVTSLDKYNTLKTYLFKNNKPEAYLLVRILAGTGMRPSEVLKVSGNDVRRGYVDMVSKRSKVRRVYFTDSLRLSLQDYYISLSEERRKNFNWDEPLFTMNSNQMSYLLRSEGARAGLISEAYYPYSFRCTLGEMFVSRYADISLLEDIAGHDSIETAGVYTTLDEQ